MENKAQKQFFIFIGRSGGGKGTQAQLLKKYLETKGYDKVNHITTGSGFRAFVQGDTHVAALARQVNERGELQPEFLAVWNWANIFITSLQGGETIILDGAPRKPFEVHVLHSAIHFLGYEKPVVIYLDVSEMISREHIKTRNREDDRNEREVANKMDWFMTDVLAALDVYRNDPRYRVIHVNGNQTIDEVHQELIAKLETLR